MLGKRSSAVATNTPFSTSRTPTFEPLKRSRPVLGEIPIRTATPGSQKDTSASAVGTSGTNGKENVDPAMSSPSERTNLVHSCLEAGKSASPGVSGFSQPPVPDQRSAEKMSSGQITNKREHRFLNEKGRATAEAMWKQATAVLSSCKTLENRLICFDTMMESLNKHANKYRRVEFHIPREQITMEHEAGVYLACLKRRMQSLLPRLGKSDYHRKLAALITSSTCCGPEIESRYSARFLEGEIGVKARWIYNIRRLRKKLGPDGEKDIIDVAERNGRELAPAAVMALARFWMSPEITRDSSQQRDVIKKYTRKNGKNSLLWAVGARYYLGSLEDCYKKFLDEYPEFDWHNPDKWGGEIHIGYTTFVKYMPKEVRGRWKKREVCACEHHTRFESVLTAWRAFCQTRHGKDCKCDCEACQVGVGGNRTCKIFRSLRPREWLENFLCQCENQTEWEEDLTEEERERAIDRAVREPLLHGGGQSIEGDEWNGPDMEDLDIHQRIIEDDNGLPHLVDALDDADVFHLMKKACVMGECSKCGLDKSFKICPRDTERREIYKWNDYKMVETTTQPQVRD